MKKIKVLYISGSLGLGHITRDIAIAQYLRKILPEAGIRLSHSQTTPGFLAERIIAMLGKDVSYPDIPADGAQKAAQSIVQLLERFVKPGSNA